MEKQNRKAELCKQSLESSEDKMNDILNRLPTGESRTIRRGQHIGA
jgi:hypothetical protein